MAEVAEAGGTPVLFPSWGLAALDEAGWVAVHERLGTGIDRFVAFELGAMFVPYGRIYSLDAYRGLMGIPACIGSQNATAAGPLRSRHSTN